MPLTCIGLSHHTAPGRSPGAPRLSGIANGRSAGRPARLRGGDRSRHAADLRATWRFMPSSSDYESGVAQIKSFLTNFRHGTTGYDIESYLYTRLGHQAVEHLFRVCTGLDSMLIGEAEILGQVKEAYVAATQAGSLGRTLHRLFREAIAAGKIARAKTHIGSESVSIATAAVEAARVRLGTLEGRSVSRRRRGQNGPRSGETTAPRRRGASHRHQPDDGALSRADRGGRLRRSARDARTLRRARRCRRRRLLQPAHPISSSTKSA